MPSFQDSALIVVIALLLFGPKGMAKLARELGKLMGEFRRASADFRMQMEDEFRLSEQEEQKKKIAAMEAAAPVAPAFAAEIAEPEHPHMPPPALEGATPVPEIPEHSPEYSIDRRSDTNEEQAEPLPIASSGDLHLMPPATGLPVARTGSSSAPLGDVFDAIPHTDDPAAHRTPGQAEAAIHG